MPPRRRNTGDVVLSDAINRQVNDTNTRLKFPIDNDNDYLGSITFTAVEDNTFNLQDVAEGFQVQKQATTAAAAVDRAIRQGVDTGFVKALQREANARRDEANALFATDPAVQPVINRKFEGVPRGSVSLYLPTSLQYQDRVEYGNVDLGARGAAALSAVNNASGLAGMASAMFQDIPFLDMFTKGITDPAGQLAIQRVLGKGAASDITGAMETASGITLNPNRRSLLRGVSLRTFRFQFKMIPTSQAEAERIKQIIRFFRTNMYPEDIAPAGITVGYKFPHKFVIQMRYKGQKVATGILPCFLDNFDTNYNPNSMSMMRDGNFPEIDISMSFVEHRTLRKADIEGGY